MDGKRFLVLALSLICLEVSAQSSHDYGWARGYLGLRGGYISLEDVDEEGSFNLGAFGGVFLGGHLSLETSFDFQYTEVFIGNDDGYLGFSVTDRETNALQLGLNFNPFPYQWFRPYLEGGVGYYWSRYTFGDDYYHDDYHGDGRRDDGGYYTGVGFEAFGRGSRSRGFSLVTGLRWLFTQKDENRPREILDDGFLATVGLKLKF